MDSAYSEAEMKIPPPKKSSNQIQLNRTFDSIAEMESHVANQYKGATIVKHWEVQCFACIIDIPENKPQQKVKK